MSRPRRLPLFAVPALLSLPSAGAASTESQGVNLTADEAFGARRPAMALEHAGLFQEGADGALNSPAAMNDADDFSLSTAHAETFGSARFDNASLLIPWHPASTLALGLARYAVSGIEIRPEGLAAQPDQPELFTAADWLVSGAFARRFGALDVGGTLHLLYRQLDQTGLGLRADAMAQYTFEGR